MASQRVLYPVFNKPHLHEVGAPRPYTAGTASGVLPVLKPRLPTAAEILPYLEAIDARRWYSNGGPLVTRLEEQLSRHLGVADCVVTTANGTVGLTVALLARKVAEGSLCLMPSWTFVATPHAARAAGMIPWFHDVDPVTWALDPEVVRETVERLPGRVGAVIVVSPFGAPIDIDAWHEFEDETGIAVVVDGAAAFDTVCASRIPIVVSLHATKILGAGEGGFVITTDPQLRDRARAACNFGFVASRTAMLPALNAKMSEYHAAVALAGLAAWSATRARHARVAEWYRAATRSIGGVSLQPGYGEAWVSGTTNVALTAGSAAAIASKLQHCGIDTRKWWGEGCHVQPAFADCPRGPLPVTEELGARVLGLPHFPEMQRADVERVAEALAAAIHGHSIDRLAEKTYRS
jgi:dTDP-4-amino-4,6-dideoxygalactose transaminase